jgi:hypothetical protein
MDAIADVTSIRLATAADGFMHEERTRADPRSSRQGELRVVTAPLTRHFLMVLGRQGATMLKFAASLVIKGVKQNDAVPSVSNISVFLE